MDARELLRMLQTRNDLLFTMSDNPHPHAQGATDAKVFSRTNLIIIFDRPSGGARRDRTDDLLLAKQALAQLSYGPEPEGGQRPKRQAKSKTALDQMVGLGRLELP